VLVDVYGQADPVEAGSDLAGLALGLKRSRAVMDYLIAKGVAAERIMAKSRGSRPFANQHPSDEAARGMRFASTEVREAP
jgi:outer membrane protein OmpA-like peptidoglycan-associated protein